VQDLLLASLLLIVSLGSGAPHNPKTLNSSPISVANGSLGARDPGYCNNPQEGKGCSMTDSLPCCQDANIYHLRRSSWDIPQLSHKPGTTGQDELHELLGGSDLWMGLRLFIMVQDGCISFACLAGIHYTWVEHSVPRQHFTHSRLLPKINPSDANVGIFTTKSILVCR
jgi:hypothetical protein